MKIIDADAFDAVLVDAQKRAKSNFQFGFLSSVRANLKEMPEAEAYIEQRKRIENLQKVNEDLEERIAIMSEGDTEAMLNKACETIANFDLDFVCDDNVCNDGWCNEHCKAAGQKPECFRHWLLKQTTEPPKEGEAE